MTQHGNVFSFEPSGTGGRGEQIKHTRCPGIDRRCDRHTRPRIQRLRAPSSSTRHCWEIDACRRTTVDDPPQSREDTHVVVPSFGLSSGLAATPRLQVGCSCTIPWPVLTCSRLARECFGARRDTTHFAVLQRQSGASCQEMGTVTIKISHVALIATLLFLASCVSPPRHLHAFIKHTRARVFALEHTTFVHHSGHVLTIHNGIWLGGQLTRLPSKRPHWLLRSITLVAHGTATWLFREAAHLVGKSLRVENLGNEQGHQSHSHFCSTVTSAAYSGSLLGFINQLANRCGVWWRVRDDRLIIYRLETKTFLIDIPPGLSRNTEQLGDEGGLGSSTGQALSAYSSFTGPIAEQQERGETRFTDEYDPWPGLRRHIKTLLSPAGRFSIDTTAGTVTVRDVPPALRRVKRYIHVLNTILARQVALVIRVYSLRLRRQSQFAAAADVIYKSLGAGVVGEITSTGVTGGSNLKAAVLKKHGPWSESHFVLETLDRLGQTALLTTGSGVVVDDEPLPVDNTRTLTYLAQVSNFTTANVGSTTSIEPGTVTYGFALTAIPHILRHRRIELSVFLSISNLDALTSLTSGGESIEGPDVSSRDLSSTVIIPSGATLVLAGYQRLDVQRHRNSGLGDWASRSKHTHNLIVVTVQARLLTKEEA